MRDSRAAVAGGGDNDMGISVEKALEIFDTA